MRIIHVAALADFAFCRFRTVLSILRAGDICVLPAAGASIRQNSSNSTAATFSTMAANREYRSDDTLRPDLPDAPLASMECCQDDGAEGTAADGDVFGKEERSSPIDRRNWPPRQCQALSSTVKPIKPGLLRIVEIGS